MIKEKIGFFYPTRGVGGAQYLFARMADYLIEQASCEVVLIDFEDGFIRTNLGKKNYHFIPYKEGEIITIDESLILVLSLSFLSRIDSFFALSQETKLFFWDLHPYNLVEQMALSGFYKKLSSSNAHRICVLFERSRCIKLTRFIEHAVVLHGLAFMSDDNRYYNQQLFGFSGQVKYLPIPIANIAKPLVYNLRKRLEIGSTIHIGWLSRLDSWKVLVLLRVLNDIETYENMHGRGSIHFHIIGDGPERENLQTICVGKNISIAGKLEGNALTEYMLANDLHLGFAMGTSALEFAVRGIPVILTPGRINKENFRQDEIYRWLFDSKGYNVASEEMKNPESLHTFFQVVQTVQKSNTQFLGERCKEYAINNHDVNKVGALLAEYLSHCNLTYEDVHKLGLYQLSLAEHILFGLKRLFKSGYTVQKRILSLLND